MDGWRRRRQPRSGGYHQGFELRLGLLRGTRLTQLKGMWPGVGFTQPFVRFKVILPRLGMAGWPLLPFNPARIETRRVRCTEEEDNAIQ